MDIGDFKALALELNYQNIVQYQLPYMHVKYVNNQTISIRNIYPTNQLCMCAANRPRQAVGIKGKQ